MRKPKDPRHHGMQEPQRVWTKQETIVLNDLAKSGKVSLRSLIIAWNKALNDILKQGVKITEGPTLVADGFYSRNISILYAIEIVNNNYDVQKSEYDKAIANYEEQLTIFIALEEKQKSHVPNLDEKIARAEERLANLKAHKAGQPLPFPE